MNSGLSRWRGTAWPFAALFALAISACGAMRPVRAGCFAVEDPQFTRLRPLVDQNDKRALAKANDLLAQLPANAAATEPRNLAALYAIQSDAYGTLSLNSASRASALKGLALVHGRTDPLRLVLLSDYGLSFSGTAHIDKALILVERARAAQRPGSRNDICLQIVQGAMDQQRGRSDLAIGELTRAYLQSASPSLAEPHMEAASVLATVLRRMGDFDEALALIGKVVKWDTAHGSATNVGIDAYVQGQIFRSMGDFHRAIASLRRARAISLSQGDHQGVAYADMRICQTQIGLGRFAAARRDCLRAEPILATGNAAGMVKETHVLLARIDLAEGHPARALALLNRALDHDGTNMAPHDVPPAYLARARTSAALGNYRSAYTDLQRYVRLNFARNQAARLRLREALEVRFHAKQEFERNAVLRRKLQAAAAHARQQTTLLRTMEIGGVAGILITIPLLYILFAGRRHRRQLLHLANEDNLTGAPNRGYTAQLATAALQTALDHSRPLTVALLDFDHFKEINDQCGHAAGDYVLKEFARLARGALRSTDILGRWGGEEFLLILPDTMLASALASIERLRLLARDIVVPEGKRIATRPRVSFSAGLATTADGAKTLDEIVARADAALYEAKNAGRDLVRIDRRSAANDTPI